MDLVRYLDQWRHFADRLEQTKGIEAAQEFGRGYTAQELSEMETTLEARFGAPGFQLPEPLRTLMGVSLFFRVQWKVPGDDPIVGSTWLIPQDVFETEEESGMEGRLDFWGTARVLEPISDTESVVAVFASPATIDPALYFRDDDQRWPLDLTIIRYLEEAWKYRGLYGWHRTLATGGDMQALRRRVVSALGDLATD